MLKSLKKYIKDDEYSINIWDKFININNFKEIIILENNKAVISLLNKKITISGDNITINRLLDSEILLSGEFYSITMGDLNV